VSGWLLFNNRGNLHTILDLTTNEIIVLSGKLVISMDYKVMKVYFLNVNNTIYVQYYGPSYW